MPTEPQKPGPYPLEPNRPAEIPQPDLPVGVPAPQPDIISPSEPQGIPPGSPTEVPQPPDPQPTRET
jgi:hypothetical protein